MKYYVRKEPKDDGRHIVHAEDCQFLPNEEGRKALGDYASCETAMRHAREEYGNVDGCHTCAPACHAG
jgi:hypothetical protein